ncbi:MAG: Ig-like domain-containing protein [Longimicrobiales bacterium]
MKRVLALPLAVLLAACGDSGGSDPVEPPPTRTVASVSVAPETAEVPDGGTVQITATLTDQNGQAFTTPPSGVSVAWSSDDTDIASVSATGAVTANRPGAVEITATASGKSASASITVTQVATALVAAAGDAQNGDTGAELAEPLVARVEDRHGDPVAGVEVTWAVTSGGGSVDPATGTTDAAGVVSTRWTLGSEPGEQTVRATAAELEDVHVDFVAQSDNQAPTVAITAPADGATFTHGDDVAFEGTANDPEDGALTGDALVWTIADQEIGTGTSFSTNALDVGAHTVTLTATDAHGATGSAAIDITIEAAVTCSDVVTLGDGASMQGALPSVVVNGAVSVTGATTVCGSLVVTGDGALDLGAHSVTVADSFRVEQRGTFTMQNDAAVLQVAGDVYVGGANTTGLLTAGRIEIGGDLRVQRGHSGCCTSYYRAFDPSGTHLVVLNGSGPQSVTFSHTALTGDDMRLNNLRIDNTGTVTIGRAAVRGTLDVAAGATITGDGPVMIGGELRTTSGSTFDVARVMLNGAMSVDGAFSPDTTWFDGTNQQIQGGLDYGMLIVRGTAVLAGDVQASTGATVTGVTSLLDIAAHELDVGGDFRVESAGQLRMTDASGMLRIAGDALFASRISEALTAGTIELAGDFTQQRGQSGCCNSFQRSFVASGTHTVVLNGNGAQTVTFSHPGLSGDNSRINNLRIENGAAVTFGPAAVRNTLEVTTPVTLTGAGRLLVGNLLSTVAGSTVDVASIELHGAMNVAGEFAPDTTWFVGTDQLIQGALDYNHVVVSGTALLDGDVYLQSVRIRGSGLLDVGAHTLGVIGEVRTEQSGRLRMTDAAGLVRTHDAWFGGGNSDELTAGAMEVTGNFTQRRGSSGCCIAYDRSFRASGGHLVVMNGTTEQVIDFNRGSITSDWSRFHMLRISNPTSVSVAGAVAVGADLELLSALSVPLSMTLDIGGTLFMRGAAVLAHDGGVTADACVIEAGTILMGPDPCG